MMSFVRLIVHQVNCVSASKHISLLTRAMASESESVIDVKDKRVPYKSQADVLLEEDIIKEPIKMFTKWFKLASETPGILEANAMNLATSTKLGAPSARMVLMKEFSENGFIFYTNYNSRKSIELLENPRCALTFYWEPLKRSVRIEGFSSKLSEEESDKYFKSRPYDSQIGALASDQSKPVMNRAAMEEIINKLREQYPKESHIPRPPHWGGFRVWPYNFEFWQGQSDRVHDRFLYTRKRITNAWDEPYNKSCTWLGEELWYITRLFP